MWLFSLSSTGSTNSDREEEVVKQRETCGALRLIIIPGPVLLTSLGQSCEPVQQFLQAGVIGQRAS